MKQLLMATFQKVTKICYLSVGYRNRTYISTYGTSIQVQNFAISTRLCCTLFKPARGTFCYLYCNRIANAEGRAKALDKV
jgi:hypothetical protein